MAVEWFCKISGKKFGPLSSKQLKTMVQKGRLLPEHEVTQGTGGPWVPADRVKGLFADDGSPAEDEEPDDVPVAELVRKPAKKPAVKLAAREKPGRRRATPSTSLPVAQAAPQPPAAPAVRRAKAAPSLGSQPAVAQPVAAQPLGANPLGIVTGDHTPTAKATGRTRAASLSPEGRKKQNLTAVVLLALVVVALAGAGIWLMVRDKNPDDSAKKDEQTAEEADEKGRTEPKQPGKSETPPAAEPDESKTWRDASQESILRGDVRVKILSAKVGVPLFIGNSGNPARPKDPKPYLLIQVQLRNTHPNKKLDYTSWSVSRTDLEPEDDFGNTYKPKRFAGGAPMGQLTAESIYPDATIEDLLVFEPPIDKIKYLRLELPAEAFGESGTLRFEIPKPWIGVANEMPEFPETEPPIGPPTEPVDTPDPLPDEIPIDPPPDPGPVVDPGPDKRKPKDDFPDLFGEEPAESEKPDPFGAFKE
ncbi:MAG TPA: DUF4339 domain-containing protein [Thermoguttaceae bacterium]|nr:DUF4339 domain-containing protein [Thermoguttaceae bacterium]